MFAAFLFELALFVISEKNDTAIRGTYVPGAPRRPHRRKDIPRLGRSR